MYAIEELRHNRMKQVDVPSPATLYKRYGFGLGTQKESGEEFLDPSQSKVQVAASVSKELDKLDKEAANTGKE